MPKRVSATRLRRDLFQTLREVQRGATVLIERDGKVVARLVPAETENWRQAIEHKPRLLVSDEEAFKPLEDWFNESTLR